MYYLIFLYLFIVLSLLLLYKKIKKDYMKVMKEIYFLLDYIFFEIYLFLINLKSEKYKDVCEILFYEKEKFLKGMHYDVEDFKNYLENQIIYLKKIEDIFTKEIVKKKYIDEIKEYINLAIKISKTKKIIKKIINILTLNLYSFINKND